jgi:hypothetical protein
MRNPIVIREVRHDDLAEILRINVREFLYGQGVA